MNLDPGIVGSPALFKELLSISSDLDRRYNITKQARVWSNVDVPGFVRSSVPLLSMCRLISRVRRSGAKHES